ncbi:MAG: hypothetical protein QCI00_10290, partial [Candidatus Thermoplasmatota archaeon]|nr:hypothetical protein [Candidatus Thermoplasmatota archaeon]
MMIAVVLISTIAVESITSEQNTTLIKVENFTINPNRLYMSCISINDVINLGSYNISLTWDPNTLTVKQTSNGEIDEIFTFLNNSKGVIHIVGYNLSAVTIDKICIAEILFEIVGNHGDVSNVIIEKTELLTAEPNPVNIVHDVVNAVATIEINDSPQIKMSDVIVKDKNNDTGFLSVNNVDSVVGSCSGLISWDPGVVSVVDVVGVDLTDFPDDIPRIISIDDDELESEDGTDETNEEEETNQSNDSEESTLAHLPIAVAGGLAGLGVI